MTNTVDDYIAGFPEDVRALLTQVRATIRGAAPEAAEGISYGMPAYKLNGKPLIYFAAFKKHIGLYATPSGHEAFAADLAPYKRAKGSVQFPFGKPMPYDLIERMTRFRVQQVTAGG